MAPARRCAQQRMKVSISHYEATESRALFQDDRSSPPRPMTMALAGIALAMVPAVFWASIVWFFWGWLVAAVVTIVVLVVSVLTMGILRSAAEIDAPDAAAGRPRLRQVA